MQIFQKTNISYPLIPTRTCAYQGVRNVRFFGKFDVLCFLETPVFRFTVFFCLITDEETVNKVMSYLARSTSSAVKSPLATAAICPTAAFNTCKQRFRNFLKINTSWVTDLNGFAKEFFTRKFHWYPPFEERPLHKNWRFSLRISSVNVTKSAVSCGFGHIYWRNPEWKFHFLCSGLSLS